MADEEVHDVAVVGIGPVGAVLAGLLGRRGLRVVGIEREPEVVPIPRAGHIDHTVLRTVQEIGCLDAILDGTIANQGLDLVNGEGDLLVRLRGDVQASSGLPASVHFHQPRFETLVREAITAMPSVELRLGTELLGLDPEDGAVRLRTTGPEGERVIRASYVVGCDGATSSVRQWSGIEFEDLGFEETWVVVDLLLRSEDVELPGDTLAVCDPDRPMYSIEMEGRRHRLEFMALPGEDAEDLRSPAGVAELLKHWVDPGHVEVERVAVYQFHALLARDWRAGRVLLAGDAAHQMPPFLGQGLCTGVRDVTNLAWKLEHTVRHGAPSALLDSYGAERRHAAGHVIDMAVRYGRLICTTDPDEAAARDRELAGSGEPPERRLVFRLGALPAGDLVLAGGGRLFPQPVAGEVRLDDLVGPRFLVLGRTREALGGTAAWWSTTLGAVVATPDDLTPLAEPLRAWLDRRGVDVVVVRPDRHVLGTATRLDELTPAVRDLLAAPAGGGGDGASA